MKKAIIARKKKSQRIGLLVLFLFMVCACIAVCVLWTTDILYFLLFLPGILSFFFVWLYYETWQITLATNQISIRRFWKTRTYTYAQIAVLYTAVSYTLHDHICITFSDGKRIILRAEDENAGKARRCLQSHHSIRNLNW